MTERPDRLAGFHARAVVETIRQPLLVLDSGFRVSSANRAFYRDFEVDPGSTIGAPFWELGGGQWDVPALRELLERVLAVDTVVEDFEVRDTFPGLGLRSFLVNARQVDLESEGEDERDDRLILLAFEDVTDRIRAQQALEHHARQLERSNRDLEEFAHAASHDLQEPLRKVRTFADRLAGSLGDAALDEKQRLYLDRMQDAAIRMQTRIDDLLVLARVSRQKSRRVPVDLDAVVAGVLRDLEGPVQESGAEIEVGSLPVVVADAAHMELLFQNLISNALKYREPDEPPRIRVRARPLEPPAGDDREWTRIEVTDNGIGFEQVYAEQIFRPFERLHGRGEYEGSGVGLSVCRRVVELHGGWIRARSAPGEGATFEIDLPNTQHTEEI